MTTENIIAPDAAASLGALLASCLAAGLSVSFGRDAGAGDYFADVLSTDGTQATGIADSPLGALEAAAAEYGIAPDPLAGGPLGERVAELERRLDEDQSTLIRTLAGALALLGGRAGGEAPAAQ